MADTTLTAHDQRPARRTPNWWRRAACRGCSPAVFFPVSRFEEEKAKAICSSCPVRAHCLDFAVDEGEALGIWGGLNPGERSTRGTARKVAEGGR